MTRKDINSHLPYLATRKVLPDRITDRVPQSGEPGKVKDSFDLFPVWTGGERKTKKQEYKIGDCSKAWRFQVQ